MFNSITKNLKNLGYCLLVMNFLFHIFNINLLITPFGFPAVMTVYTSISLLFIYFSIATKNEKKSNSLLLVSFVTQVFSLILLDSAFHPNSSYLLSSSVPTTVILIIITVFLSIARRPGVSSKFKSLLGPLLSLVCLVLTYSYITESMFLLGISSKHLGVGLSIYTLFSFFIISTIISVRYTKLISLESIQINFSYIKAVILIFAYSLVNFLIIYCPEQYQLFYTIFTQIIFLTLSFHLILKPFIDVQSRLVTVCAWSKKVKVENGSWLNQDEHLAHLGIKITHGISPEEKLKLTSK